MNRLAMMAVAVATATALTVATPATAASWQVPGDCPTIQAAIDSGLVIDGDRILVEPGEYAGALVTKSLEIKGEAGAIINDGPAHSSGMLQGFRFLAGSDGATISHLRFEGNDDGSGNGVGLAIMNAAGVSDITVTQSTFINTVQAISNWGGSGWEISHNVITD